MRVKKEKELRQPKKIKKINGFKIWLEKKIGTRCPIPLLRERRIKAKYDRTPAYCPNCGIYAPANQPCHNVRPVGTEG